MQTRKGHLKRLRRLKREREEREGFIKVDKKHRKDLIAILWLISLVF